MKLLVSAIAAATMLVWTMPHEASAQNREYRVKSAKKAQKTYRRPPSIASNGLCQRDTATQTSDLNLRNRCDVEEFWTRMQELGGDRW